MSQKGTKAFFFESPSYGQGVKELNSLLESQDAQLIDAFPLDDGRFFAFLESSSDSLENCFASAHPVPHWQDTLYHLSNTSAEDTLHIAQSNSLLELIKIAETAFKQDATIVELKKPIASQGHLVMTTTTDTPIEKMTTITPLTTVLKDHFS